MATIKTKKEIQTFEDSEGNITKTTMETTVKLEKCKEPDFIKIYTDMWCEFNRIPSKWRGLFLQLAIRMTYCKLSTGNGKNGEEGGQLVNTGKPFSDEICRALGWMVKDGKTSNQLMQGLRELCKCNAIKKINRGVYQINPKYAGKGEWKYNPKADRGGVESLIAQFNFADHDVKTEVVWADDGNKSSMNESYREGLGVDAKDKAVLQTQTITPTPAPTNSNIPDEKLPFAN